MDTKPTNPKDAIGCSKLPLDLVPDTISLYAATAFADGAAKYGSYNWRMAGVRASIYRAALERHLKKWWNGEDWDRETGVHHLASVIACAGILLDAEECGKLTDDRPPAMDTVGLISNLEDVVRHVYHIRKDCHPHHYTEAERWDLDADDLVPSLMPREPGEAVDYAEHPVP